VRRSGLSNAQLAFQVVDLEQPGIEAASAGAICAMLTAARLGKRFDIDAATAQMERALRDGWL